MQTLLLQQLLVCWQRVLVLGVSRQQEILLLVSFAWTYKILIAASLLSVLFQAIYVNT